MATFQRSGQHPLPTIPPPATPTISAIAEETHVVHEDSAVLGTVLRREQIDAEGGVRRAVARHHALRGAVVPRVDRAHEALIEIDADRHVAAFARRRHRRLELRVHQLSGHLQSNGNGQMKLAVPISANYRILVTHSRGMSP